MTRAELARFTGVDVPEIFADHPAAGISWHDAMTYCGWLATTTGVAVRLPTAAEWMLAAAGADGRTWPWGDSFASGRCNTVEAGHGGTTPVDAWPSGATVDGVWDMAGNVWEWCSDVADGGWRVLHGGSWLDTEWGVRCARTLAGDPAVGTSNVGFRVAADVR